MFSLEATKFTYVAFFDLIFQSIYLANKNFFFQKKQKKMKYLLFLFALIVLVNSALTKVPKLQNNF
jgi:hypothetical protein